MRTDFYPTGELVNGLHDDPDNKYFFKDCPIPKSWLDDIPNMMGINLVAVKGVKVVRQDDRQISSIEIQFIPNPKE